MTLELTREYMLSVFPISEKPLSDKEITDFLECNYQEEYSELFQKRKIWIRDLPKKVGKTNATKQYTTKKAIKQEIKNIGDQLEKWLEMSKTSPNEITTAFIEACMEDLFNEKERLQSRLRYTGVKFSNNDIEKAKMVPIGAFIRFNRSGFASCLWHSEKSPSMHKISDKEKVHCFGCGKTGDIIDVVMTLNNCTLPEALKIILK